MTSEAADLLQFTQLSSVEFKQIIIKEIKMNQRIIYPTDDGGVAVLIPAPECGLTIEEIAAKDVPLGKPFKIVDVTDIPSDRTFRNAWEYAE
jgi:hypothetical protein